MHIYIYIHISIRIHTHKGLQESSKGPLKREVHFPWAPLFVSGYPGEKTKWNLPGFVAPNPSRTLRVLDFPARKTSQGLGVYQPAVVRPRGVEAMRGISEFGKRWINKSEIASSF